MTTQKPVFITRALDSKQGAIMNAVAKLRTPHNSNQPTNHDNEELFQIVKKRSFKKGEFKLSSGATSNMYFDLKPTMMSKRGAFLCAQAFLAIIEKEKIDFVGGLAMGAVPIIGSLAAISEIEQCSIKFFFVREKQKSHGTMRQIEGLGPEESLTGAKVLIVDDVATTGNSIMKAIEAARNSGSKVDAALVLVDRQEGAADRLNKEGVRLISIFHGRDFL